MYNKSIEYFFSILKQEYLTNLEYNFQNTNKLIVKSIYDYNEKRFLGYLKNKTPTKFIFSRCL